MQQGNPREEVLLLLIDIDRQKVMSSQGLSNLLLRHQFESKQEQIAYNACNAAKRAISKPYTLFLCVIGIWNQFLHQPFCHNWYSTPVVLLLPCLLFAKNSCFAVPAATGMKSRSRMEVQDGSSTAMAMILITA